ncbi:MAG: glutamate--tRNA ligase [Dehalococcoidia bacterium]|nr:glutamate--tRNA ligase [Dehalococcoidia bacterium]
MSDSRVAQPVRTRIAPSPTGHCHVGTARTALFNLLYARQHGGSFVLRIEDTDAQRSSAESERGVLDGLSWLGLEWDEGPDRAGPYGPYRSSERLSLYEEAAYSLVARDLAYTCYCTAEELKAEQRAAQRARRPPKYSGRCRDMTSAERRAQEAEGRSARIMFKVRGGLVEYHDLVLGDLEENSDLYGDIPIMRSTGWPLFNFAVVVDDHSMAISHVLRGPEHVANTYRQVLIYEALAWDTPSFGHLPLLLNPDRSKISKRKGAVYVGDFRDQGYLPEAMVNFLALLGWHPSTEEEVLIFDSLLETFSLDRVSRSPAVFDDKKLEWLNGVWIRSLELNDLVSRASPFLNQAGLSVGEIPPERIKAAVGLEQERVKRLSELPEATSFFLRDELDDYDSKILIARRRSATESRDVLASAKEAIAAAEWDEVDLEKAIRAVADELGWRHGHLFMIIRGAITGRTRTPPLFDTMLVVGRDRVLTRLDEARDRLDQLVLKPAT